MEHSLSSANIEIKLNTFERPIIYENMLMVNDASLYLDLNEGRKEYLRKSINFGI